MSNAAIYLNPEAFDTKTKALMVSPQRNSGGRKKQAA